MHRSQPRAQRPASTTDAAFKHLVPGSRYVVAEAFTDFDGCRHPVGESFRFLRHSFLPYEDGLSLVVAEDGLSERRIRLQWRPEQQGPVIDALDRHLREAP
jgi:hypothetical protein